MKVDLFRDGFPGAQVPGADKASRVRAFGITDDSVDLHNTTFALDGWDFERFMRNPVVLLQHGWVDDELPVMGKSDLPRNSGKRIEANVELFSAQMQPLADRVMGMIDAGVLGASISARPDYASAEYNDDRETGDDWMDFFYPPLDFKRQVLTEWSIVTIGSNANAVPVGRKLEAADADMLSRMGAHHRAAQLMAIRESARAQAHQLGLVKNLPARIKKMLDKPERAVEAAPVARAAATPPPASTPPQNESRVLELGSFSIEKFRSLEVSAATATEAKAKDDARVTDARRRGSLSLE